MGRLSTHVLDTALGKPGVGVEITLYRLDGAARTCLTRVVTNRDGRTDSPLLVGDELVTGVYELVFAVGNYFADKPVSISQPPFLDEVPIRVTIADAEAHYHVPLLVSPWSYTTYRGS